MYIRVSKQKDSKTKKYYTTHRLVEGYRTPEGKVRQQILLNLGVNFSVEKAQWPLLAKRINELLSGQDSLFELPPALEKEARRIAKAATTKYAEIAGARTQAVVNANQPHDYQEVDINTLEHNDVRHIGAEHLGVHAAEQIELAPLLQSLGFNQKQSELALASIIGRLIKPGSELATHRYLKEQSSLDELLGTDFSSLSLKNFYKVADSLLKKKEAIEKQLYQRESDLFNLPQTITLYDITNTYFEGSALQNPKAAYGRSKEKRTDCPLVSMGLALDSAGFVQKTEILKGNVSEPKTMVAMLDALNATKEATIVMDAGFATEDNIQWLKDNQYFYIVVSRRKLSEMPSESKSVLVKEAKNNNVNACLVHHPEAGEVELYCHSEAKEAKTKKLHSKAQARYEGELEKIANGLQKKTGTKKPAKINERLGRLKERYSRIAKQYTIDITCDDKQERVTGLTWVREDNANALGIYCLRSNREELDEQTLWSTYTTLTEVESAFRSLKTELGFRPVYHQKEVRVDAHLFISVLAYHLLQIIRYQLKLQGINSSWQTIRQLFSTQIRLTTGMMTRDGKKLSVRKTSNPTPEQQVICKALGIDAQPGKTEKVIL